MIRIGFWGLLYYNYNKNPQHSYSTLQSRVATLRSNFTKPYTLNPKPYKL